MSSQKKTRALGLLTASLLAVTLGAGTAFAVEPSVASGAETSSEAAYEGTNYTVSIYAGNQGMLSQGDQETTKALVFESWAPGERFSFDGVKVNVPADSKYYAKGIRLAALDNVRSDKNRDGENTAGVVTSYYAQVDAAGNLVGEPFMVEEDTDLVVAYGIMANRVSYTVNYVDADGNALQEPRTFFGDIGDTPALSPVYIENYVPDVTRTEIVLRANEAENVITYRYTRLAPENTTELAPDGTVDVRNEDGSLAQDVYTTDPSNPVALRAPAASLGGSPGAGGGTTSDEDAGDALPPTVYTDNGTEVLADDGTPLAQPGSERINDDANALASGQQPGDAAPAANTAWIPWTVAAAVLACLIAFILVKARKEQQRDEGQQA